MGSVSWGAVKLTNHTANLMVQAIEGTENKPRKTYFVLCRSKHWVCLSVDCEANKIVPNWTSSSVRGVSCLVSRGVCTAGWLMTEVSHIFKHHGWVWHHCLTCVCSQVCMSSASPSICVCVCVCCVGLVQPVCVVLCRYVCASVFSYAWVNLQQKNILTATFSFTWALQDSSTSPRP